jgi:hypothetical protein
MHVGSLAVWSILLSSEEKRQATVVRALVKEQDYQNEED